MIVVSRHYVEKYILGFSENPEVQTLLRDALLDNIFEDRRYHKPVRHLNDLPSRRLRKKFSKSQNIWYIFSADEALASQIKQISSWLESEIERMGETYNTRAKQAVKTKIRRLKSIEDVMALCGQSLLTDQEIQNALSQRTVSNEELAGHIRHVCNLPRRHTLIQIITPKGMVNAGRNAKNCLGSLIRPDKNWPHRTRVKSPERWLYFSIRDEDNHSIVTIGVNVQKGKFVWEGNKEQEIRSDDHETYALITPAIEEIKQRFPHIGKEQQPDRKRPYGSFGTFKPPTEDDPSLDNI